MPSRIPANKYEAQKRIDVLRHHLKPIKTEAFASDRHTREIAIGITENLGVHIAAWVMSRHEDTIRQWIADSN